jgi:hypothetical protein
MTPTRPTAVKVLAILGFCYAGLLLLCGICGGGGILVQPMMEKWNEDMMKQQPKEGQRQLAMQKRLKDLTEKHNPHQPKIAGVLAGIQMLLGVGLIFGGVGLLRLRSWARKLHLGYAVLALLLNFAMLANVLLVTLPAQTAVWEEFELTAPPEEKQIFQQASGLVQLSMKLAIPMTIAMTVFWLIHPTMVLIILFMPTVAAAFRGQAPPGEPGDGVPRDSAYGDVPPWRPGE